MRTIIVSMIGISSLVFVIMIQQTVNTKSTKEEELKEALTTAMYQTMTEVMEKSSYGISNRNEMMASFLQAMIQKVGDDMELSVKIHELDYEKGSMDIEATGSYRLFNEKEERVTLRRQIAFVSN